MKLPRLWRKPAPETAEPASAGPAAPVLQVVIYSSTDLPEQRRATVVFNPGDDPRTSSPCLWKWPTTTTESTLSWYDDQIEFEFVLAPILDGLDEMRGSNNAALLRLTIQTVKIRNQHAHTAGRKRLPPPPTAATMESGSGNPMWWVLWTIQPDRSRCPPIRSVKTFSFSTCI